MVRPLDGNPFFYLQKMNGFVVIGFFGIDLAKFAWCAGPGVFGRFEIFDCSKF